MRLRYIVRELLAKLTEILKDIPRAPREAQLLLMHHLQKDELWLITHQNTEIETGQKIFEDAMRRADDVPLEYITNRVSFYSQQFYIDEGALIPRPETELLIDEVKKNMPQDTKIRFVEVGVGSGIISVILAQYFTKAEFFAVDISTEALRVAATNIERFGLGERITLIEGSLLDKIDFEFEYLVSNPPYIANGAPLERNLSYEPQNALFGGEAGDEIIQKLLDEVLKRNIRFFSCEIGYDQKDKITNYLSNKQYKALEFYKDLSGFDRGFTLKVYN